MTDFLRAPVAFLACLLFLFAASEVAAQGEDVAPLDSLLENYGPPPAEIGPGSGFEEIIAAALAGTDPSLETIGDLPEDRFDHGPNLLLVKQNGKPLLAYKVVFGGGDGWRASMTVRCAAEGGVEVTALMFYPAAEASPPEGEFQVRFGPVHTVPATSIWSRGRAMRIRAIVPLNKMFGATRNLNIQVMGDDGRPTDWFGGGDVDSHYRYIRPVVKTCDEVPGTPEYDGPNFNVAIPGPLQDDSVLRAIYRGLATPERGSLVVPKALLALETIGDRCLSGRSVPVTQGFSQTTTTRDGFGTYKGESTETFDVTIRVRPLMVDWVSQQLRLYPFTGKTPIYQAVGELINRQGCGGGEMRQFEEGLARLAGIDPATIDAALGPRE